MAQHDRQPAEREHISVPKIISTHSFRGGTGKSNTTANLAVLVARTVVRVELRTFDSSAELVVGMCHAGLQTTITATAVPRIRSLHRWNDANRERRRCYEEKKIP